MRPILALAFLPFVIAACAPTSSPLPVSSPTALSSQIIPSPVAPTQDVPDTKTINGITFLEPQAIAQDGKLITKICYVWEGEGLWELGKTTVRYQGSELNLETSREISQEPVTSPLPSTIRCVENTYHGVSEIAAPIILTIEIESVHLSPLPEQGKACELYQSRWMNSQEIQSAGIEAKCVEKGETPQVEIEKIGNQVSLIRARELAWRIAGLVNGPWIFEVTTH